MWGNITRSIFRKKLFGYQNIGFHVIFDVKMYGHFTRKSRLVYGGHTNNPP